MPTKPAKKWATEHGGCDGCRRELKLNHMGQHYAAKRVTPKSSAARTNTPGRLQLRPPARFEIAERFACTNKGRIKEMG